MPIHLEREVERLKDRIRLLSEVVETQVKDAFEAAVTKNGDQALKVVAGDDKVDTMEVELEEECLKVLALYQPVATDLRHVVAFIKMNNDLERIGDLAANIAQRAVALSHVGEIVVPNELIEMGKKTKLMLKKSLLSLFELDADLARDVLAADAEIDSALNLFYKLQSEKIREAPEFTEVRILLLSIARNLERIADLASNIAEDAIYILRGEIIRHQVLD